MVFSDAELKIVNELLVPSMGTEVLAPLLHFLVRFTRAQNVLEGGTGYTTPFIASALARNNSDFHRESQVLKQKTHLYLKDLVLIDNSTIKFQEANRLPDKESFGLGALYNQKTSLIAQNRFEWLEESPSWVRPGYYMKSYVPQLICLDDLSHKNSSASRVEDVIQRVGLSDFARFENADFWTCTPKLLFAENTPFDLIWIDLPVGLSGLIRLLSGDYWDCLRPDGGILIIHDMMTTRGGQLLVNEIKRQQANGRFNDFEITGFLEPNRLMQGDFILIRKTSALRMEPVDDIIQHSGISVLEREAAKFIKRTDFD